MPNLDLIRAQHLGLPIKDSKKLGLLEQIAFLIAQYEETTEEVAVGCSVRFVSFVGDESEKFAYNGESFDSQHF